MKSLVVTRYTSSATCSRSGMLILVYARNHLRDSIGEVTTASVACGVLGVCVLGLLIALLRQ